MTTTPFATTDATATPTLARDTALPPVSELDAATVRAALDTMHDSGRTNGLTPGVLILACLNVLHGGQPSVFGTLELDASDAHGEATVHALLTMATSAAGIRFGL